MAHRGRKSRAELAVIENEKIYPPVFRSSVIVDRPSTLDHPTPPAHLGKAEHEIWHHVFSDYELTTQTAVDVLTTALEAHQRCREAGEQIRAEGMTIAGRDGQQKVHPLLAVERDARQGFFAGLKALRIEL